MHILILVLVPERRVPVFLTIVVQVSIQIDGGAMSRIRGLGIEGIVIGDAERGGQVRFICAQLRLRTGWGEGVCGVGVVVGW